MNDVIFAALRRHSGKPRLRRVQGVWQCDGRGMVGFGRTPMAAYSHWNSKTYTLDPHAPWRHPELPNPLNPDPFRWDRKFSPPFIVTCAAKGLQ